MADRMALAVRRAEAVGLAVVDVTLSVESLAGPHDPTAPRCVRNWLKRVLRDEATRLPAWPNEPHEERNGTGHDDRA